MTGDSETAFGDATLASAVDSLDAVAEAFSGLRSSLRAEDPLDSILQSLAVTATKALPAADAVSVTMLSDHGPRTVAIAATTAEILRPIDEAQHRAYRGPCVDAARTKTALRGVVGNHRERWPEFTAAAEKRRLCSYLCVPVVMGEGATELLGTFNLYSFQPPPFQSFDEELMKLFTAGVGAAIGDSRRWRAADGQIEHLHRAMESRAEIEQAKGVLIAVHGIDETEAFEYLVRESQHSNTKLHDVAHELIESVRLRKSATLSDDAALPRFRPHTQAHPRRTLS